MLQFFKGNRIQNYFFVLIYVLILRSHTFFTDYPPLQIKNSILFDLAGADVIIATPIVKTLSVLIILYQAIYINRIVSVNNLIFGHPMYASVIYVLLLSLLPEIHPLNTILIGNTFLIIAVFQLFQVVHRNQRSKRIFNAGFLLGLATLCDINFIYLVPFFIIAANSLVVIHRNDILLYILGVSVILYFLWAYWFVTDQLTEGIQTILSHFKWFDFPIVYENYGLIKTGLIGLLILFIVSIFHRIVSGQNIFIRNKLIFLFYMTIFTAVSSFLGFGITLTNLLLIFLPLSVLLGLYLHSLQKSSVAESFHFLLFLLAILFQYFLI